MDNELLKEQALASSAARAEAELSDFVSRYCVGKNYDSCHDSPCRYASIDGCQHPMHPKYAHAVLAAQPAAPAEKGEGND